MRSRQWEVALCGVVAAIVISGCGGKRIEHGIFHSAKGFRVHIPERDWTVTADGPADLELRRRDSPGGIMVNAVCNRHLPRRPLPTLALHLLAGFRDRTVVAREEVRVNGLPAAHSLLEGRLADGGERVRVESYVMKDERCVYDLVYVAPTSSFEDGRADFERLTATFRTE